MALKLEWLPPAPTVDELAKLTGTTPAWVREQQRQGVIAPLYTKGLMQFSQGAIVRLAAVKQLQTLWGTRSAIPQELVRQAGAKLDAVLTDPAWVREGVAVELADGAVTVVLRAPFFAPVVSSLI